MRPVRRRFECSLVLGEPTCTWKVFYSVGQ